MEKSDGKKIRHGRGEEAQWPIKENRENIGKGRRKMMGRAEWSKGGREGTNGPHDLEVTQMCSATRRGRSLWRWVAALSCFEDSESP